MLCVFGVKKILTQWQPTKASYTATGEKDKVAERIGRRVVMETYLSTCFTFRAIFHGGNDAGSAIGELQFRNGAKRNGLHWPRYTAMEMAASKSASVAAGTTTVAAPTLASGQLKLTCRGDSSKARGTKRWRQNSLLVCRPSPITHRRQVRPPFSLSLLLRLDMAVRTPRYSDTVLTSHLPKQLVVMFAESRPAATQLDAISRMGGWVLCLLDCRSSLRWCRKQYAQWM